MSSGIIATYLILRQLVRSGFINIYPNQTVLLHICKLVW